MNLIHPLLTLLALHFFVLVYLFYVRLNEIIKDRVHPQKLATRSQTQATLKNSCPADNFMNLFEMPIVFYVISFLLVTQNKADNNLVTIAWLYVGSRYIHSFVHCTYNKVMHRFYAFVLSNLILIIYFIISAYKLI